ncbi:MAG: sulfatase [Planctomycetota bacterium]
MIRFIGVCAAALFLIAALCVHAAEVPAKPNIVFILADDLGWADTTLYGHTKLYRTPNIERLAQRGMTFTRGYSASPLCSPTRSAILTGLSPARTGITTPNCHVAQVVLEATIGKKAPADKKSIAPNPPTRLKTDYHTLAKSLKAAGYATGHFGKWHLGSEPYSPLQQGFDVDVPHWPGPGPAGSYVAPWKFKDFDHDPDEPNQHLEDRMAKEAVKWIEKNKDTPFYLNYWMFSVHAPFDAKKALIEKYKGLVDPTDLQRCPTYAAMVESMDDAVGTLMDTLDRLKISEHTIIVFTSDNGGNMYNDVDGTTATSNRPLRGGKATVFEGGVRVPLIVAWPGVVQPKTRSDFLVQSEDFYPTFLDALKIHPFPNQRFDGISVLRAFKGESFERPATFTYFPHDPAVPDWLPPAVAIHSGDWKLIRIFHGGENAEHRQMLFNLRDDLGEKNNLATKEPERVKELDAQIEAFLVDTKAVVPIANPAFDHKQYHPEDEGKSTPKAKHPAEKKPKEAAPAIAKKDDSDPKLQGWKARNCDADVKDGIVTIKGKSDAPFLGVAPGTNGPATVTFRAKCSDGGEGKVEWMPSAANTASAKSLAFTLKAGDWQEIKIEIPATGPLGILRIYLPAQKQPVSVDWIDLKSATKPHRWEF